MKGFFLFSVLFLCVSCGDIFFGEGTRNECHFRVDRGFAVKWRQLPVPIYMHEAVPDISRDNFIYAMDIWNESWNYRTGKGRLFEMVGEGIQIDHVPHKKAPEDGVNILFLDRQHKILSPVQQGVTHLRNNFGGAIFEADIILNNVNYTYYYEKGDFDYSVYTKVSKLSSRRSLASTSSESFWKQFLYAFQSLLDFLTFWKKEDSRTPARKLQISKKEVDFISLALHELGHVAALVHIDHVPSIMNSKLSKGQIRRDIGEIELSKLVCGYER